MTSPAPPTIAWQGTVPSGTYRVVDLGAGQDPRVVIERQQPADALGGVGWQRVNLPLDDVLEAVFAALFGKPAQ